MFDYCEKKIYFIEISCPADINVPLKEAEKVKKCHDQATDYNKMYDMHITIVPVVLGCTGVVSSACMGHIKKIPNFKTIFYPAIIGTICILRSPFT